jgi:hypothetical protein
MDLGCDGRGNLCEGTSDKYVLKLEKLNEDLDKTRPRGNPPGDFHFCPRDSAALRTPPAASSCEVVTKRPCIAVRQSTRK